MPPLARLALPVIVAAAAVTISLAARADGREELVACQLMIDRAPQAPKDTAAGNPSQEDAQLRRCRQIVRDWTLRDSRMSVDEKGRPLR